MTWEHVGIIASLIIGISGALISISKSPHETKALDGDAANKFATAAGMTADENIALRKQMKEIVKETTDRLTSRIATVEEENKSLQKEVRLLKEENRGLREWAECLCGQVIELGGRPALIRSETIGK